MICSIEDCGKPAKTHGWCNGHRARWYKYGNPLAQRKFPPDQRFWRKVEKTDLCWLFRGTLIGGWGQFYVGRIDGFDRKVPAHRYAYELLVGPIPEGMTLDHLCRVRNCVNPEHLEPCTRGENTLRGETITAANVLKTHCPQGHEYTKENTYIHKGHRICRACTMPKARERARQYYQSRPRIPVPPRTTCRNGHPKTPENQMKNGKAMTCRLCWREKYLAKVQRPWQSIHA